MRLDLTPAQRAFQQQVADFASAHVALHAGDIDESGAFPRQVVAAAAKLGLMGVTIMVAQGRTGQWGSLPFSGDPKRVELIGRWAGGGGMRIAQVDGEAAGCMVVGPPTEYVSPAPEPEVYVQALVIDRRFGGRGVGRASHANTEAPGGMSHRAPVCSSAE